MVTAAMLKKFVKRVLKDLGYELIYYDPIRHEPYSQENITSGKLVSWNMEGVDVSFFVVDQEDSIQREHLRRRFYELEELEIIKSSFRGGVFLDVGANVGNHSLYVAMFLGASKVISIEPNPVAYRIFRVNVGLNGQYQKIVHYAVGLSDAPGHASLHTPVHNLGGTQLAPNGPGGIIEIVTGDDLLSDSRVDFIKIDTEGMELNVLRGLAKTIARNRPKLFVEVDNENANAFADVIKSHNYVIKQRYRRYTVNENYLAVPG